MGARGVAILGSTGSIGRTALRVIDAFPERFDVVALTANRQAKQLLGQVEIYDPDLAALAAGTWPDGSAGKARLKSGWEAILEAARHPDAEIVINALVGAAGLEPTLEALAAGKRLALANKESLVVAGELVQRTAAEHGGELIPVDSEHSAVFQCLQGATVDQIERIVLTASGGPFLHRSRSELEGVTPEDALEHPTWEMGDKITIDSATLANKAMEVVEAHHLFGVAFERISVVIHPQSIVHSMVEFRDGSVLAQMGQPTMAVPVLYALSYPERLRFDPPRLDLARVGQLDFQPVPEGRFTAFDLGCRAGRAGGTAPVVFNAANEEAVHAFLDHRIRFTEIGAVIEEVLGAHAREDVASLEDVRRADAWAREVATVRLDERTPIRTNR